MVQHAGRESTPCVLLFYRRLIFIYNRRHPYNRTHLECSADEPQGKRSEIQQFHVMSGTESQENAGYGGTKRWENKMKIRKMYDKSYTPSESYTLSFTRNPQYIKGFSRIGVGNVGEKHKTFFEELAPEMQNIGLL